MQQSSVSGNMQRALPRTTSAFSPIRSRQLLREIAALDKTSLAMQHALCSEIKVI
jgi:hypothetical protein